MLNLSLLARQVCETAKEAGAFIRDEQKKFNRNAVEKNMRTIMYRMSIKNRKNELSHA